MQRSCVAKDSSRLLLLLNAIHVLWGNVPYIEQYKQACRAPAIPLNSQIPQHEGYLRWSAIPADRFNCAIQRRRVALFLPHARDGTRADGGTSSDVRPSFCECNKYFSISISNSATIKIIPAVPDAALKNSGRLT